MGMFDYVVAELPCPKCGAILRDWQTKSGECVMEHLTVEQVSYFYTTCPGCGRWVEYERTLGARPEGQSTADYVREHFTLCRGTHLRDVLRHVDSAVV